MIQLLRKLSESGSPLRTAIASACFTIGSGKGRKSVSGVEHGEGGPRHRRDQRVGATVDDFEDRLRVVVELAQRRLREEALCRRRAEEPRRADEGDVCLVEILDLREPARASCWPRRERRSPNRAGEVDGQLRAGVIVMPPMMKSNLPASSAGMNAIPSGRTSSTLTPISSASFSPTSTS